MSDSEGVEVLHVTDCSKEASSHDHMDAVKGLLNTEPKYISSNPSRTRRRSPGSAKKKTTKKEKKVKSSDQSLNFPVSKPSASSPTFRHPSFYIPPLQMGSTSGQLTGNSFDLTSPPPDGFRSLNVHRQDNNALTSPAITITNNKPPPAPSPRKRPLTKFHLFLELPPELRNAIYRLLVTTPRNFPIELPCLTGAYGRRRAVEWARCNTANKRRLHKTIFLEILQTSRQVHAEASGILYGCNTFKYRCEMRYTQNLQSFRNPILTPRPTLIVLPTRHLHMLKNVKIWVMNHTKMNDFYWDKVSHLISCFSQPGMSLETFEFVWYGNAKCRLDSGTSVFKALRDMNVERHLKIRISGSARMRKEMQDRLQEVLEAKKVEIQRPVRPISGGEFSSDDDDDDDDD